MPIITGKLLLNHFGNGFVNNGDITVYLDKKDIGDAYHLQTVEVDYFQQDNKYFGKVINFNLIGKIFISRIHHFYQKSAFLYTSELRNKFISFPINNYIPQLQKNDWVKIQITKTQPNLTAKFLSLLSKDNQVNIDDIIATKFNLTICPESSNSKPEEYQDTHRDQIHLPTFTIDPASCQDADDAFSVVIHGPNEIHILVHISDVAHYINPNHPDFGDIIRRGNTYYGKNTNWSMIPAKYANNICSILPGKKTLVHTCEYIYQPFSNPPKIELLDTYYSVIESKKKFNYEEVDDILENKSLSHYNQYLQFIHQSSKIIKSNIPDFNVNSQETDSHLMVKYWMIQVNQTMASKINALYRVHPFPPANKKLLLDLYLKHQYHIDLLDINDRNQLLQLLENNPTDKLLAYLVKNMLDKAKYTSTNQFHYGLGIDNYTHWTSPIRRGCDLLNHCLVKGFAGIKEHLATYLESLNDGDILQDSIEKFILLDENINKSQIGDEYSAIIIGLNHYGAIIYLPDLDNKFHLHISKLDSSKLAYDAEKNTLSNEYVTYKLLDNIKVKVAKIGMELMEFDLVK